MPLYHCLECDKSLSYSHSAAGRAHIQQHERGRRHQTSLIKTGCTIAGGRRAGHPTKHARATSRMTASAAAVAAKASMPYSGGRVGKPKHISKSWKADGLGVEARDGFHQMLVVGEHFVAWRALSDGIELRSDTGNIASLKCVFTVASPPPVEVAILPGDPNDEKCWVVYRYTLQRIMI